MALCRNGLKCNGIYPLNLTQKLQELTSFSRILKSFRNDLTVFIPSMCQSNGKDKMQSSSTHMVPVYKNKPKALWDKRHGISISRMAFGCV